MKITNELTYGTPITIGKHKHLPCNVILEYRTRRYYNHDGMVTVVFQCKAEHKNVWEDYSFYIDEEALASIWELCVTRLDDRVDEYRRRFCNDPQKN